MMRCPLCTHASYTRTSRYITEQTKEAYYQCQSLTCSCTFKTVESVDKILCQPIQAQPVDENALPPPEKRTLNRYRRYNSNPTLH
ncbi:ogr/Delta-like zinc finger family protein [Serratia sp. IR-2025]|uniref:ogr/Delta-like zinc finger family protein n=1 Tax=Serratia nevei TaxID=2703794 RepID=UPI0027D279F6|nr:ogr/Delta-like zinc finger family protein [Serratia nevei]MBX9331190.1 ogr/Delta-like zinc finger family protein [Serratia marcescens]WMC76063.1 ogr/Delta-like zinc finger family protein [Serratia nevei]WMC81465.1 ogr/Delta-like zinc finger family protein [Serratia nevei]